MSRGGVVWLSLWECWTHLGPWNLADPPRAGAPPAPARLRALVAPVRSLLLAICSPSPVFVLEVIQHWSASPKPHSHNLPSGWPTCTDRRCVSARQPGAHPPVPRVLPPLGHKSQDDTALPPARPTAPGGRSSLEPGAHLHPGRRCIRLCELSAVLPAPVGDAAPEPQRACVVQDVPRGRDGGGGPVGDRRAQRMGKGREGRHPGGQRGAEGTEHAARPRVCKGLCKAPSSPAERSRPPRGRREVQAPGPSQ